MLFDSAVRVAVLWTGSTGETTAPPRGRPLSVRERIVTMSFGRPGALGQSAVWQTWKCGSLRQRTTSTRPGRVDDLIGMLRFRYADETSTGPGVAPVTRGSISHHGGHDAGCTRTRDDRRERCGGAQLRCDDRAVPAVRKGNRRPPQGHPRRGSGDGPRALHEGVLLHALLRAGADRQGTREPRDRPRVRGRARRHGP